MVNRPLAITFAILFVLEILFIVYSFPAFQDGLKSENWSTSTGTILSSFVISKEEYTDDDYGPTYSAQVIYEFEVENRTYKSDKIHVRQIQNFSFWDADRSKAQGIVDKYPQGTNVTVYYDSKDPNNCALEPGLHIGNYLLFLISMIFLSIMLILFYAVKPRMFNKE